MAKIFQNLTYLEQVAPLDGALQMAIDERLLIESDRVCLRDYEWADPTTSIGYFGVSSEALAPRNFKTSAPLLRRPTGGGSVAHGHGEDFTYSLVVAAEAMGQLRLSPRESYRAIHGILAEVLREFGVAASLAGAEAAGDGSRACFANPVADDLLCGGEKIAGAGQKRSRGALLHQGSVQPVQLPRGFGFAFAAALADQVVRQPIDPALLGRASLLADQKYRSDAWNHRR